MGGSEQAWPGVLGGKALGPPPAHSASQDALQDAQGTRLPPSQGPWAWGCRHPGWDVSLERRSKGL